MMRKKCLKLKYIDLYGKSDIRMLKYMNLKVSANVWNSSIPLFKCSHEGFLREGNFLAWGCYI